jgi:hypothetical protein
MNCIQKVRLVGPAVLMLSFGLKSFVTAQVERHNYRQTDRQADRQTDRQVGRQAILKVFFGKRNG